MSTKTYSQIYYENNKEYFHNYLHEKTVCECGKIVCKARLARHKRTKIHEKKMRDKKYLDT